MRIWSDEAQPKVFWLVLLIALVAALLIAAPGQTVVVKYVNDLFIFLDGAHRIDAGQVPNRDFHTALGPLNFYLPAIAAAPRTTSTARPRPASPPSSPGFETASRARACAW